MCMFVYMLVCVPCVQVCMCVCACSCESILLPCVSMCVNSPCGLQSTRVLVVTQEWQEGEGERRRGGKKEMVGPGSRAW